MFCKMSVPCCCRQYVTAHRHHQRCKNLARVHCCVSEVDAPFLWRCKAQTLRWIPRKTQKTSDSVLERARHLYLSPTLSDRDLQPLTIRCEKTSSSSLELLFKALTLFAKPFSLSFIKL